MWQRKCTPAKILPKLKGEKIKLFQQQGLYMWQRRCTPAKIIPNLKGKKTQLFQKQWLSNVYVAEKVHNGQTGSRSADCHSLGEH